jgi:2,6-dihydroxypseudooxynicotine hydrolase
MTGPMRDPSEYVAPTYLLTSVPAFVDSITDRGLADGLLLKDIRGAGQEVAEWKDWADYWAERALEHEAVGDAALARGSELTAGQHFARASLCAHYGQFLFFEFPEAKQRVSDLKVRLFARAAPLIRPSAERIDIPSSFGVLPAYLRIPPVGSPPYPCVVHVGGLDAAKEDSYQFSNLCLERGLAILTFDGPGQGETFYAGMRMGEGWNESVTAVIDHLEIRPEIDSDRIGVIGRSTGGFLAARATAAETRVKALAVWGAMYDLAAFDDIPPLVQEGYRFITESPDLASAKEAMRFVNMEGHAGDIMCPIYVLHGGRDNIAPPYNAHRLMAEVSGPATLSFYDESIHCNHDVAYIERPAMADFLATQLGSAVPPSG